MRKIAIMIGSDSDLAQCSYGLEFLKAAQEQGKALVVSVITNSIHRNTEEVLANLRQLSEEGVDILIAGAGMANHLTGTCDAFLRYTLLNTKMIVVGVAFEDKTNHKHTFAAQLSIKCVPGTQVVYNDKFWGDEGFWEACRFAVDGELPKIELKEPKPAKYRSLEDAFNEAKDKSKETEEK